MTWSILARTPDGRFGAAIASRFFAVGAFCVRARRGVGIVSSQALLNPLYGPAALDLLAAGFDAAGVVAALTTADAGRDQRQLHVLPARGAAAQHTGSACVDWCGHADHGDFSVAGNMLAGPRVLADTADAFRSATGTLAERLIAAMHAGEAAGGDKRGRQSAALWIQGDEDRAELDLRVDDHADPLAELRRLHDVSLQRFQPFLACLPGRHSAAGELDRATIEARIERFHAERRATSTSPTSFPQESPR